MPTKIIFETGFDEAGRGPLAGPVYASSVILPADFPIEILNDSKKLSEKKRLAAETVILEKACYGIAFCDEKEIDKINILEASMLAMKRAFEIMIKKLPQWCRERGINYEEVELSGITDGNRCPDLPIECRAEPKADGKYPCVMAASILAKNERDRFMKEMDKLYPQYGYAGHKGYPTAAHRKICREIGPSPIQRLSFKY
ncbi:ribonuclease HII [Treponema sp. C6A8]|uniref:ribonuclease HII n=1 Tax=Treponema sp. C6A8 TaxID=1410609 RepID=UPI0004854BEE|nr:ribonuclease HII [Treponema sp. C6A8]